MRFRRQNSRCCVFGFFVLMLSLLVFAAEIRLRPLLAAAACAEAKNRTSGILSGAVSGYIGQKGLVYSDYVTVIYDSEGRAAAIVTNTDSVNLAQSEIAERVNTALAENAGEKIQIPLGNLGGMYLFSGKGPRLEFDIGISPLGGANCELVGEFISAGLNQTLHRLYFVVSAEITVFLPFENVMQNTSMRFLAAETVIVGEIPQGYAGINTGRVYSGESILN